MKAINLLLTSSVLSLPIMMSLAFEAKADLIVCNTSSDKAYVAKAWYSDDTWLATGWTHVYSGECEAILIGDMREVPAYIYVADDNWKPWQLQGEQKATFCLQQSSFRITDAHSRCALNMIPKTFYKVGSPDRYDYTLRLK